MKRLATSIRVLKPGSAAVTVVTVLLLLGAGSTSAFAQCNDSWTGAGGDGLWSDNANWTAGEPGSTSNACITLSGAAVTMDVSDGILNLTLGSTDSLLLPNVSNANLNVGGSSITNRGQIDFPSAYSSLYISSGGIVTLSGGGAIVMNSSSNDEISGYAAGGTLVNEETIEGAGNIENDITLDNASTGVVNANQSGAELFVGRFGGTGTNTGLMEATNGGELVLGSATIENNGGTMKAVGANSFVGLGWGGEGGLTVSGGTYTTSSGGVIYVQSGAVVDGTSNTVKNSGSMLINDTGGNAGASFQGTFNNTGTLQVTSAGDYVTLEIPNGETFTHTGSGAIVLGDGTSNAYNNYIDVTGAGASGGTLVNEATIEGTGNITNDIVVTNTGTIDDNVPIGVNNLYLWLGRTNSAGITNTGTLEGTNGGGLILYETSLANNGGKIQATGTGSWVDLYESLTVSGGTLTTSGGGTIYGQEGPTLDGTTNAITNSGTLVVDDSGPNSSYINAQGTLTNTGIIQLLPSASDDLILMQIPNGETLTLTGKGTLTMGDGTDNAYNNNVSIGSELGTTGTLVNQSTIQGTGAISLIQGITNAGTINANVPVGANGLELILNRVSDGITNTGTIEATNGGEFSFDTTFDSNLNNTGTLTVGASSTMNVAIGSGFLNLVGGTLTGGTYDVTGTLLFPGNVTTNNASITLTGTASQILNPSTNALAGLVTIGTKGSFTLAGNQNFTAPGNFTNSGTVKVSKGSTFTVGGSGSYTQSAGKSTVDGTLLTSTTADFLGGDVYMNVAGSIKFSKGSVFGNGGNLDANVSSSATITPADSATTTGLLTVTGTYTQSSTGALDINVASSKSGQFNVLAATGTATLGGTLNIGLLKGYVPAVGATFKVLTASTVKGNFATVNGTSINGSEHFTVTYNTNNVTLTVVAGA